MKQVQDDIGGSSFEMDPKMFQLAAEGKLKVETMTVKLEDIAEPWNLDVTDGKRLVVTI